MVLRSWYGFIVSTSYELRLTGSVCQFGWTIELVTSKVSFWELLWPHGPLCYSLSRQRPSERTFFRACSIKRHSVCTNILWLRMKWHHWVNVKHIFNLWALTVTVVQVFLKLLWGMTHNTPCDTSLSIFWRTLKEFVFKNALYMEEDAHILSYPPLRGIHRANGDYQLSIYFAEMEDDVISFLNIQRPVPSLQEDINWWMPEPPVSVTSH